MRTPKRKEYEHECLLFGYAHTMTTVLISGASGFIGSEITRQLRLAEHTVLHLVRRTAKSAHERSWDPESGHINQEDIDTADAVINLSGASIGRLPWTPSYKKILLTSRLNSTKTLTTAMVRSAQPPRVFLSGSAVGFYGSQPGKILTEKSPRGDDFLARLTNAWEKEAEPAQSVSRVVNFRTGLVLGNGGILRILRKVAQFGLAGPLGNGEQHWPWISLHDEAAAIIHLMTSSLSGPVNLAGPESCTAAKIMKNLAQRAHRPYWFPAPAWAISALLAEAGRELMLADQNQSSELLRSDGFVFQHQTLDAALDAAGAFG